MIFLIAGPSGSGKTTYAEKLKEELNNDAVVIPMDAFYRGKNQLFRTEGWHNNPQYCDIELLVESLKSLSKGENTTIPQYSMAAQDRVGTEIIVPKKHVIVEGLWTLTFPDLRELGDFKIYIDCSYEERLNRRVMRDGSRGWSEHEIVSMAPQIESLGLQYIEPYKQYADIVLNT
jgi:uridine kinase